MLIKIGDTCVDALAIATHDLVLTVIARLKILDATSLAWLRAQLARQRDAVRGADAVDAATLATFEALIHLCEVNAPAVSRPADWRPF